MKKLLLLGMAVILTAALAGCGGGHDDNFVAGPGLVGIDDSVSDTAPLLRVDFVDPVLGAGTAQILSNPASDGDIARDPVTAAFTITQSPPVLLFGVDSLDPDLPEFRAFLTFPLDGSTGQDALPGTAAIVSATLEVFVDQVDFASVVPTFIDLVEYPITGLAAVDFNSVPLDFRTLDFLFSDQGNFVQIDITPFLQQAQDLALLDLQTRFLIDTGGTLSATRGPAREAVRTVHPAPRPLDNLKPNRRPSATRPDPSTRHR
ncbi:MAG: hypothetical protein FIA93_04775 [Deltaproteobacteria bacterium]|nr:hypothetical protein [Deltaproteobacteria bacterium]PWB61569.1 MAG: hypothetical protein C3F14_11630 [Deltaproteobacteria bacterium]